MAWSFEQDVIDRLARIETKTAGIQEQLVKLNGRVSASERTINETSGITAAISSLSGRVAETERSINQARGVAGAVAFAVSTLVQGIAWAVSWLATRK